MGFGKVGLTGHCVVCLVVEGNRLASETVTAHFMVGRTAQDRVKKFKIAIHTHALVRNEEGENIFLLQMTRPLI